MEFLTHNLIWIIPICTLILIAILVFIPKLQVRGSGITDSEKHFNTENEARKTLAQIIGGAAILMGLFFTWKTLQVDKEGQITERFTRAIEHLGRMRSDGEPNLEIRLGGIYTLERIAKDSKRDHWQIMEVITAYVRENASWPPRKIQQTNETKEQKAQIQKEVLELGADIQAILTVLGRRKREYEKKKEEFINLRRTDLRGANLIEAKLSCIHLDCKGILISNSNLKGAHIFDSDLERTSFAESQLEGVYIRGTNLKYSNFRDADLSGATLWDVDLRGAKGLTIDQLCSTRTLYKIKNLDSSLMQQINANCSGLLEKP